MLSPKTWGKASYPAHWGLVTLHKSKALDAKIEIAPPIRFLFDGAKYAWSVWMQEHEYAGLFPVHDWLYDSSELCCNHLKALNWMLHSRSVFIASYLVVQPKCCSFCEFSSKQEAAPSLARRTAPLCPWLSFIANICDILHKQHIQTARLVYHDKPYKYVMHIIMPRIQIMLITCKSITQYSHHN